MPKIKYYTRNLWATLWMAEVQGHVHCWISKFLTHLTVGWACRLYLGKTPHWASTPRAQSDSEFQNLGMQSDESWWWNFKRKKTFLKLALRQQLVLLLLCKCLFQVILVDVRCKGTWNNKWNEFYLSFAYPQPLRLPSLLCLFLSKKQAKDWGTDLRPGLTFVLPPVILLWFQVKMGFSAEPKARAGLAWAHHSCTRSSWMEQRWSVRVSSYPISQSLCLCTGPLCAFWPSLLLGQEIKADTKFAVRTFPQRMRCGWTISPLFLVQQRVLLKLGRRGSAPIFYLPWWRACSLPCLLPFVGMCCLVSTTGIPLNKPKWARNYSGLQGVWLELQVESMGTALLVKFEKLQKVINTGWDKK